METHRLHFIITIFMIASFCISRMSTVSAMEAAASAATTNSSVVNSDIDSPWPLPYSSDDQEEVHQEQPFNNNPMILKNLDGIHFLIIISSEESASFITTTFKNNSDSYPLKSVMVGVNFGSLVFFLFFVLWLCIRNGNGRIAYQRERAVSSSAPAGGSPLHPPPAGGGGGESSSMGGGELSNLGEVLTLEQIRRATHNFNDSNLIKQGHSGDLFRGYLKKNRRRTLVVIKRIDVGSSTQKKESYRVELDFFKSRALSRTRLVSLFGHCLDQENDKFLVYEYMSKEGLSNFFNYTKQRDEKSSFHRNGCVQPLGWQKRTKIAMGVAEGLCYLHHQCSPPLVHRDVQESSILLGDNYEVRLGSLSKVCTQEVDTMITRLLRWCTGGSPSSATCAYDVYCFGKILLRLVVGDVSSDTTTEEWLEQTLNSISSTSGRKSVKTIMERNLFVDEDQLEDVWAMAIVAKSCLHRIPSKRPPMTDILKALKNPLQVTRADNRFNPPQRRRL